MNGSTKGAIERLLDLQRDTKASLTDLQEVLDATNAKIFSYLEANSIETITVGEKGEQTKATIVRPTQLKIDEDGLQSALSDAIWKLVTKRVIDKKALEDAVARGKVEPEVISTHSKEVATKPYLRITR